MRKLLSLLLLATLSASAQNPVIRDQFTADPTARVFNNKVYLYPSHDIFPPEGQRQDWFCMEDYNVFSSENLTDWTDHGVIVSQNQVPWVRPDSYSMWAPDCVERNGKYYFYFPAAPKSGRGFGVGVAAADRPEGPFVPEPEPIKGVLGIDPCVLVDGDGQSYIYWSGMGLRGAKLQPDMKQLDGEQQVMEGLPEGFKEGPFAFRRGDWYYLTFPWVRGSKENGANPTETLAYAMSKSPLGPWDFKGLIMAEHANGCWTNHHSIVNYRGQWYLFYHHNPLSPRDDKRRSVQIEKLYFNADGTIREVKATMRGVGINKATEKIEIDRYSVASNGLTTQLVDTINTFRGYQATLPQKGAWLKYADVDFSSITDGYLTICVKAAENTELFVREKSAKGKILAQVKVTVKSQMGPFRRDQSGQWLTLYAPLQYTPKGVTDLCISCEGEGVSVDWLQFKNRPLYYTPSSSTPSHPDAEGFIRRWSLLEPIRHEVSSNIILTDSYLQEKIAGGYSKLNPKKGKWHLIDSQSYHVRVFRFAEKTGHDPYHSLFWGTTVINCPEELPDVRLAAGSNGASLWLVDGRQVLTLDGDRRMVQDDGVSQRLTLKPGRHVVTFALVNGPGLSDLCVRLLDENGKPITHYTINP
ncbi:MAG: family 43 glycosylhydrolase [Prevotella sp.]|nr:family 43 glycosylhydrolase [Prevotella sp.]